MDASQWLEHAISIIFGGAGGMAAGIAKLSSSLTGINNRVSALERDVQIVKMHEEQNERALQEFKAEFNEKIDDLRKDLNEAMSAAGANQMEVQRSLGSIEGTLQQLVSNGCARLCNPSIPNIRNSAPEFSPMEAPTKPSPKGRKS